MSEKYTTLKAACYTGNITMSIVGNLSPLLFLTFRSLYGISYSLLGLLVLINFSTQLLIDLIFSFFSHKFNIPKVIRVMPLLGAAGLLIYAISPMIFPSNVYLGIVIGTIIFSASSGLAEVLLSPIIAAIPAENPDREMSKLHSIYAWGVTGAVIFSTVFLLIFGREKWQVLALIFTIVPLISAVLFGISKIPELETPERVTGALDMLKNKSLWLCVFAIFIGGATECTMAQWSSGYLENALHLPKVWGDIFGVAIFGVMLGLGRSLYAKTGKNIERVLFLGIIGSTLCYLIAAVCNVPLIGLFACAFTGFCASMLWPGSLVVATERIPTGGVFVYAMMAAGGDLGASVGPQLMGVVTDFVTGNAKLISLAKEMGLTPDQLGLKCGMLVGMTFAFIGIFVFLYIYRTKYKKSVNS